MRREGEAGGRGWRSVSAALAALILALTIDAPASAQGVGASAAGGEAGRGSVSVTAGLGIPSGSAFRDIYGGESIPVGAQVNVRILPMGLGAFGGVRWVSRTGEAIAEGASPAAAEPVTFGMTSWRLGPSWTTARGAWGLGLAGGISYNRYREEWESASLRQEDSGVGAVIQGTIERLLTRRLAALVRVEHIFFQADPAEATDLPKATLGATDLVGGIAFRF